VDRIGLFFASSTGNSEITAHKISQEFKPFDVDLYDILVENENKMQEYNYLIFGIPSWDRHYIQNDWHDFLPKISHIDFRNKVIALFGLGDQLMYSYNFLDGMGRIYDWLMEHDAKIVGQWPTTGYIFRKSTAFRNGKFVGLAIDEDTQSRLTSARVKMWVQGLKKEFEFIK
jgi:flavodoxin I